MKLEEFRELERLIRRQFEEIGAPELGAEELYLIRNGESDLLRRPDPRSFVVEMLDTLDRHLAIQDRQTYLKSISIIRQSITEGPVPEGAVVLPALEAGSEVAPFSLRDLADTPDISSLRREVRRLRSEIAESPIDQPDSGG